MGTTAAGEAAEAATAETALLESQAVFGCELIQQMGILLRLPQVAASTAQVSFHRFYTKRSMRKFDVRVSAWRARARFFGPPRAHPETRPRAR